MDSFILASGKELKLEFAGFESACKLKNLIQKELLKVNVDLGKLDLKTEINLNSIKDVAFIIDSSKDVQDALFECLLKSTYDKERITKDTFNSIDAVSDYYEIMGRCIKYNLSPFFKNLLTQLKPVLEKINKSQDLNTQENLS